MPVPAQLGRLMGHHHEVPDSGMDDVPASRAFVGFAGLVRLDHLYHRLGAHPKNPHNTKASEINAKTITITTSVVDRSCLRNGLKPTGGE